MNETETLAAALLDWFLHSVALQANLHVSGLARKKWRNGITMHRIFKSWFSVKYVFPCVKNTCALAPAFELPGFGTNFVGKPNKIIFLTWDIYFTHYIIFLEKKRGREGRANEHCSSRKSFTGRCGANLCINFYTLGYLVAAWILITSLFTNKTASCIARDDSSLDLNINNEFWIVKQILKW